MKMSAWRLQQLTRITSQRSDRLPAVSYLKSVLSLPQEMGTRIYNLSEANELWCGAYKQLDEQHLGNNLLHSAVCLLTYVYTLQYITRTAYTVLQQDGECKSFNTYPVLDS